jgi:hypothetical protein
MLTGGLSALLWAWLLPAIKRQYAASEMRRISALDAA